MRSFIHAFILLGLSAQCFAGVAMQQTSSVPTLSEWGMLSLGTAIVAAGLYFLRKHRK